MPWAIFSQASALEYQENTVMPFLDLTYVPEQMREASGHVMQHIHEPLLAGLFVPGFSGPEDFYRRGMQLGWVLPSGCDVGLADTPMGWLHEGVDFVCTERSYALSLSIRNR